MSDVSRYCVECERLQAEVDKERALNDHLVEQVNAERMAGMNEARAEGERAATERIIGTLTEAANDAQELWVAKRESAAVSERIASEYWRVEMNGLHHIITELEYIITELESSIERGEHKEPT